MKVVLTSTLVVLHCCSEKCHISSGVCVLVMRGRCVCVCVCASARVCVGCWCGCRCRCCVLVCGGGCRCVCARTYYIAIAVLVCGRVPHTSPRVKLARIGGPGHRTRSARPTSSPLHGLSNPFYRDVVPNNPHKSRKEFCTRQKQRRLRAS